jgi:hypothetical protein
MPNILVITALKSAKKLNQILNPDTTLSGRNWKMFSIKEYANSLIYNSLMDDKPAMIARLGSNELSCMVNYCGILEKYQAKSISGYIKGTSPAWWWEEWMMNQMCDVAGFFPKNQDLFAKFSKLMITDLQQVDILGSWLTNENVFQNELQNSKKVVLEDLEPFFCNNPWTKALEGKRVLVVHPFAETIKDQYKKRDKLFENKILPEFELINLKAVQSHGNSTTEYSDWFSALNFMQNQISSIDFDICIIGAGAYGFPLAAHVKRMGKKSIHLGGVTQLLFGIKGKRWEDYVVYPYTNLYNEHWVRPGEHEKPKNAQVVEGACYW